MPTKIELSRLQLADDAHKLEVKALKDTIERQKKTIVFLTRVACMATRKMREAADGLEFDIERGTE